MTPADHGPAAGAGRHAHRRAGAGRRCRRATWCRPRSRSWRWCWLVHRADPLLRHPPAGAGLAVAAVAQWAAFMDRYVGIVAIGAGRPVAAVRPGDPDARGAVPQRGRDGASPPSSCPGIWLVRNISCRSARAASAPATRRSPPTRPTSSMPSHRSASSSTASSSTQPFTGILRVLASLALLAVVVHRRRRRSCYRRRRIAARAGGAWTGRRRRWPPCSASGRVSWSSTPSPTGCYMIYSASTIAFDPVNTRYLMPDVHPGA